MCRPAEQAFSWSHCHQDGYSPWELKKTLKELVETVSLWNKKIGLIVNNTLSIPFESKLLCKDIASERFILGRSKDSTRNRFYNGVRAIELMKKLNLDLMQIAEKMGEEESRGICFHYWRELAWHSRSPSGNCLHTGKNKIMWKKCLKSSALWTNSLCTQRNEPETHTSLPVRNRQPVLSDILELQGFI